MMKEDFCQPIGYTGPYSLQQIRGLLQEADAQDGDGGRYKLNFGPYKNPHSEEYYPTYDEVCAQMWAARLCDHPEEAWFFNPRDPGVVSNKHWTREMFDTLPLPAKFRQRVQQIIDEDNQLCR